MDACKVLNQSDEEPGIELECAGYKDIKVYMSEGDLRFDVDYGVPDGRWSSFGPFNHAHTTIEWRLENGVPLAAIHRFFLDGRNGDENTKKQVLKISKVGYSAKPGCPIAYVDASLEKDANILARGAADMAADFDCMTDTPVILGEKSELEGVGIMSMSQ